MKGLPDPNLRLVTVFEARDPLAVAAAKGLLEEADIPFYVHGEEHAFRLEGISPLAPPPCRIEVGEDREAEARKLLAEIAGMMEG
jgi:hypothetical protein